MSSLLSPLVESPIVYEAARKNAMDVGDKVTAKEWFNRRIRNQRVANRKVGGKHFTRIWEVLMRFYNRVQRHGGPLVERSISPPLRDGWWHHINPI